jgi:hypothetical protein
MKITVDLDADEMDVLSQVLYRVRLTGIQNLREGLTEHDWPFVDRHVAAFDRASKKLKDELGRAIIATVFGTRRSE